MEEDILKIIRKVYTQTYTGDPEKDLAKEIADNFILCLWRNYC